MNTVERGSREIVHYLIAFLKWVLIAGVTGAVGGLVGSELGFVMARHCMGRKQR